MADEPRPPERGGEGPESLLLAVNVGNTRTALGLFAAERLIGTGAFATASRATPDECALLVRSWLARITGRSAPLLAAVAVACVVPPHTALWRAAAARLGVRSALVYGEDGGLGIETRLDMPARSVGADRLVNAVAAVRLFGAPVLVVDVGTALTVDVVDRDGAFVGGAIAPGPLTAANGLWRRAPALSPVAFEGGGPAVGRRTDDALRSGLTYGAAGQIEGLVRRARLELGAPDAPVVATGGLGATLGRLVPAVGHVEPALTLRGLRIWAEMAHPAGS